MINKRVLITGGAGLIGSHIADQVIKHRAAEVVVLDNLSRGSVDNLAWAQAHGRVTFVEGDIRDQRTLRRAMHGIDYVFHQAAIRITQCAEEPRLAVDVLAGGTFNVLEAAAEEHVPKVVAASSASIYGLANRFPTSERHHPYNNRTIYGACKAFDEGLLRSFAEMYGLKYVALRYFNVYGPRMDAFGAYTEVLIRWMERIERGEAPIIYGDGTQTMDFVYVGDVARANVMAALSDATDVALNVGTGVETSLDELARTLARVMGSAAEPEYAEERRVNPVRRRLADVSAARDRIKFTATVPLEDGLTRLVEWWRGATAGRRLPTPPDAIQTAVS